MFQVQWDLTVLSCKPIFSKTIINISSPQNKWFPSLFIIHHGSWLFMIVQWLFMIFQWLFMIIDCSDTVPYLQLKGGRFSISPTKTKGRETLISSPSLWVVKIIYPNMLLYRFTAYYIMKIGFYWYNSK